MPLNASDRQYLRQALSRLCSLPPERWPALENLFAPMTLERGEALVTPGSGCHYFALVVEGLLRIVYPEADGSESTKAFIAEGSFGGSVSAVITGVDPHYGILALEPSRVLVAKPADWRKLIPTDIHYERLARCHAESLLLLKEEREHEFLSNDAGQRYRLLADREPQLVARIPDRHLASYLGITAVQLSRIKAKQRRSEIPDSGL